MLKCSRKRIGFVCALLFVIAISKLYLDSQRNRLQIASQLESYVAVLRRRNLTEMPRTPFHNCSCCSKSRQHTLKSLRNYVQRKLHKLQNPSDCSASRKLLCKVHAKGCGLGCQLHHIGICFMLSVGTNRTLVLKHILTAHPSVTSINEAYLPLSETCSDWSEQEFKKAVTFAGDGDVETTGRTRVVKLLVTDPFPHPTMFAPSSYPASLKDKLEPTCSEPHVWWVGQLMTYITRQQPKLTKQLDEIKAKIGFYHPIVGVHIRRTDKLSREAHFRSLHDYMVHVEQWFENHENANRSNVDRNVFLATDDVKVLKIARDEYPAYNFVAMTENTLFAHDKRKTNEGFWAIVQDLALLGECDYVVCTFSSNIGRLIHEQSLAKRDAQHSSVVSIDSGWFYPGQIGMFEAMEVHEPKAPDQLKFQVGDILMDVRCQLACQGFNTRTNNKGFFPMEKARMVPLTAPYALFAGDPPLSVGEKNSN